MIARFDSCKSAHIGVRQSATSRLFQRGPGSSETAKAGEQCLCGRLRMEWTGPRLVPHRGRNAASFRLSGFYLFRKRAGYCGINRFRSCSCRPPPKITPRTEFLPHRNRAKSMPWKRGTPSTRRQRRTRQVLAPSGRNSEHYGRAKIHFIVFHCCNRLELGCFIYEKREALSHTFAVLI
jgi:hypothetical protein